MITRPLSQLPQTHNWTFTSHFLRGLSSPCFSVSVRNRSVQLDSLTAPALFQAGVLIGLESASLCPLTSLMFACCFLLAPLRLIDWRSLPKPLGEAPCTDTADRDKPPLTAERRAEQGEPRSAHTGGGTQKPGSHAEEIKDIVVLCCAVGAGDSLLLLLGDSVESKGRVSFPRLLFCVRVEVFFQDKAKMERCGSALLSLFSSFLGARGGCGCTMRRGISFFKEKKGGKGLLVSVARHWFGWRWVWTRVAGLDGSLTPWLVGVHRPPAVPGLGARLHQAAQLTTSRCRLMWQRNQAYRGVVINIRLLACLAGPGEVEVPVVVGVSL